MRGLFFLLLLTGCSSTATNNVVQVDSTGDTSSLSASSGSWGSEVTGPSSASADTTGSTSTGGGSTAATTDGETTDSGTVSTSNVATGGGPGGGSTGDDTSSGTDTVSTTGAGGASTSMDTATMATSSNTASATASTTGSATTGAPFEPDYSECGPCDSVNSYCYWHEVDFPQGSCIACPQGWVDCDGNGPEYQGWEGDETGCETPASELNVYNQCGECGPDPSTCECTADGECTGGW